MTEMPTLKHRPMLGGPISDVNRPPEADEEERPSGAPTQPPRDDAPGGPPAESPAAVEAEQPTTQTHTIKIVPDAGAPSPADPPTPKAVPTPPPPAATDAKPKHDTKAEAATEPEIDGKATRMAPKRKKARAVGGISRDTAEYVIESLSMMLLAGVTVGEAIQSIAKEIPKKQTREALLEMSNNIDEGTPFAKALEQTGLFSTSVVTLIEVGESTGKLPENLKVVAEQMHKNNAINAKIKSAMLYPAFLVSLLFIVGTGIGIFLLPKLLDIINGLDVPIGPFTKALIFFGTLFGKFGIILAAGVVVMVIVTAIAIKKSPTIKAGAEAIMYRIPGVKKLLFETEIARFGFILGTLLDAGLPVVTALESLAASMSTRRYARFAAEMRDRVDQGDSFEKILLDKKYHKLMPGTISQMVVSAERSGNLSTSLLKIGSNFEDKADLTAHNLETLLEPIILVLVAVAVLFVALAVFLPIYSLIGNLNGGK